MLINLFGIWMNPANICNLSPHTRNDLTKKAEEKGTNIKFNWGKKPPFAYSVYVANKTPDEVALEINRQIKILRQ